MNETNESAEILENLAEPPVLQGRWTVCAMLFVATSINYMDRQVLSILRPILKSSTHVLQPFFHGWPTVESSLNMNDIQYGNVLFVFQIAYALGVIFAGRFVDKMGCRKGYPIITGVWSLSAMAHALISSVTGLSVVRFFLGLGESGNFPAAIKATAEWFPPRERSLATGIFNSGACMGAILAPALVPWVAVHFGWRAAFLITGIFSTAWIIWWSMRYRTPSERMDWTRGAEIPQPKTAAPSIWKLLSYRQAWGFAIGKFMTDPVWWFFLFWLPQYFSSRFGLDLIHLGPPLIIVYLMSTVGSVCGGWLPRGYMNFGLPLKKARLAAMLTCACLIVPVVVIGKVDSVWVAVALLSLATAAHQGWSANIFTTSSDMFPAEHVGTVVSFGQVAGAIGGAIFQPVVGHLVQATGSFVPPFIYAGTAYLVALFILSTLAPGLRRANIQD